MSFMTILSINILDFIEYSLYILGLTMLSLCVIGFYCLFSLNNLGLMLLQAENGLHVLRTRSIDHTITCLRNLHR